MPEHREYGKQPGGLGSGPAEPLPDLQVQRAAGPLETASIQNVSFDIHIRLKASDAYTNTIDAWSSGTLRDQICSYSLGIIDM